MIPGSTLRAADLAPALAGRPRIRPVGADPAAGHGQGAGQGGAGGGGESAGSARDAERDPGMSDRQRRLLALLSERPWITTTEYCEIVGVSPRTALRDVRELVESGAIVMDGKRRGARYRLK
jgi:DNA-binding CsgD family transcriptional regulator